MSFCQYGTGITVLGIYNFCGCFSHVNASYVEVCKGKLTNSFSGQTSSYIMIITVSIFTPFIV